MRRPDNPFCARAIVNRVWAHYFGRGIVDPPDHLSPLNPPSHPELLQELADGFIKNGYDFRWLHRTILTIRTYQRSSRRRGPAGATRQAVQRQRPARGGGVPLDAEPHADGAGEADLP